MKQLRKISKKYYLRQIVACWTICAMLLALSPTHVAMAAPTNPVLKYGNATFDMSNPAGVTVTVNGLQHIIHWDSLNTTPAEFLRFVGTGNAAVLNRVMNGIMTQFNGELSGAGMRIFIINPAGVVFGSGARINVAQLVASSLDISDSDFLADRMIFGKLTDNYALEDYVGNVIFNAHAGNVAADRIYLIGGKEVWNKGGLVANDCVVMAAGNSVIINETGSSVAVVVDMGGGNPADFKVKNMDQGGDGVTTKLEADHVVLAAGDIWSQAISNVETVDIYAEGEIQAGDLAEITASATPSSPAVAGVSITSGSSITIDDDIMVTADGEGTDDASATINVTAGEDLTIKSDGPSGTELIATATDGLNNNTADVTLTAEGAFVIDAPDKVTVQAEADAGEATALLNQANVKIKGESVLIQSTDAGSTDEPATVKAYAHDATVNRAGVDIEATDGDVEIIGAGSNGDSAIVLAKAENGSENHANVGIKATGDVDIIAQKGQPTTGGDTTKALVLAKAEDAEVSNDASVDITAGGDVTVMSEGGQLYYEIYVYDHYQGWHWEAVTEVPEWYEGDTSVHFTPYEAKVLAIARNAMTNNATVDITAGGDVKVIAKDGGIAEVTAIAENGTTNNAGVDITAGGDVKVLAIDGQEEEWRTVDTPETWDVKIKQLVLDKPETWDVRIKQQVLDTPENWVWKFHKSGHPYQYITTYVNVQPAAPSGYHYDSVDHNPATYNWVYAWMEDQTTKYPTPTPGWQLVNEWRDHHDATYKYIYAWMEDQTTQYPTPTPGWQLANEWKDYKETTYNYYSDFNPSEASIKAKAENGLDNTATVGIDTVGGDVLVLGTEGGEAGITALAKDALSPSTNTANVTINATAVDITEMVLVSGGDTPEDTTDDVYEEQVVGTEGGDVKVIAKEGGEAEIEALAIGEETTNNAGVLICADGDVKVIGKEGGEAEIEALAKGYDSTNTATVGICAKGEEGVEVIADRGGEAGISSKAKDGEDNTASTIVHADGGGVLVKATRGGDAEILAQAKHGITNDAFVGICSVGSVVVQTGEWNPEQQVEGCDAVIRAEAEAGGIQLVFAEVEPVPPIEEVPPVITTADARTVVVSHQGNVEVLAYNHGHSGIEAEAEDAHLNTASVGVAAGADLSPAEVIFVPELLPTSDVEVAGDGPEFLTGNVIVEARGDSEAQIYASAHDATPIYEFPDTLPETDVKIDPTIIPGENTASVVICAPGEVRVEACRDSTARIKSQAGSLPWQDGDEGSTNKATTKVYASEVTVHADGPGNGIRAYADGVDNQGVENYCLTAGEEVALIVTNEDGSSELVIQDYSKRTDCPDCPPCPCEEAAPVTVAAAAPAAAVPAPVAPLTPYYIPRIEGCPQLTQAAAAELGIPAETLQVGMGNALALNPNLQPCASCATLLNAASILKDADGSRMAAMLQAFNAAAPADAPFTPEMATSIAMTFQGAAEGSQYASAMEFVDAFVQYASALDAMGSPTGDSTAFVMGKYGKGLGENSNMSNFVAGRIKSGQTF